MTTEELRLKITVDTSDVNKLKKEFATIQNDLNKKVDTKAIKTGAKESVNSVEELKESIQTLQGLSFADMIVDNLDKINVHFSAAGKNIKSAARHIKESLGSVALGFNQKHWHDLGYDNSFSENLKNIKWGIQDAKEQWVAGFAHMRAATHDLGNAVNAVFPPILRKLALLAAAVASVVAVIRNGFSTALQGKQMNVLAQQAGMSADAYQKWAFILSQTGLQVDDMIGAQQTLLEAQVDVREGSEEMIAAFQQIGLSQQEVLSMNQQQLFDRTVAGLQNMGNSTERATVAFKLLSEDSKNLAPLLNLTNEQVAALTNNYNHLHSSMSDKLIEASNRLQASVGNLKAAWMGLRNTLAELLMPILTTITNALTKAIVVINLFLRSVFGLEIGGGSSSEGIEGATNSMGGYTESVESATEAVEKLKRTTMGFDELNIVGNPNSGSGSGAGADAGVDSFGGGFAGGFTDSLFNADDMDMSGITAFFEKWQKVIQDIATYGLIGIGTTLAVIGGLTGNIPLMLKGIALASLGIALGNIDDGSLQRLMDKYGETIHGIIAPAMIGIGATLAVLGGLMGNIPLLKAGVIMAGIGLGIAAFGNENGFKEYIDTLKGMLPDILNWAIVAVGACGAVKMAMSGNWLGVAAFAAMAGIGVYNIATGGNFWEDAAGLAKKAWEGLRTWFIQKVKPVFTKAWWAEKFSSIKAGWDEKMSNFKATVKGKWDEIANWWTSGPGKVFTKAYWSEKFDAIKQSANEKLEATKTTITTKWDNVKSWFGSNVAPKFTKQYWLDKFNTIKEGISTKLGEARTTMINAWNNIKSYWSANIAPKFTLTYWQVKFDTIRAAISEKLNAARTTIMNAWNNIKQYWNVNIAPKFTKAYWSAKFDTMRAAMSEKVNAVRTTIMNGWNNVKSYWKTNIAPKFTTTFWKGKFDTIKSGAKSALNGVIGVFESAVNHIIKKINTLNWKIPDWVPKVGGEKFGFNFKEIKIPRLATGGIAIRSTLANVGENGREAILPLDNNTAWMDALANKLAQRMNTPSKIVLKVGEKELGWATINSINGITKQTGGLQLQL